MLHEHEKVAAGELVQSALTVDHRNQPEPPAASSQQIGPELTAASAKRGGGGEGESSSLISSIPSSAIAATLLCFKGRDRNGWEGSRREYGRRYGALIGGSLFFKVSFCHTGMSCYLA